MGLYDGLREGAVKTRNFVLNDPSHGQGPQLMEQAAENRSLRAAGRMAGANGGMGVAELDNFKGGLRNWGANHLEGARIDAAKTYKPALDRVMTLGADAAEGGLKARAGAVFNAGRALAAPAQAAWLGGKTAYDVATTPTEDYQKRLGVGSDSWWSKSDSNGAQLAKDLVVRGVGAASDLGNNMAFGVPKALGLYSDVADNKAVNIAQRTSTGRIPQQPAGSAAPAAAPAPQAAPGLPEGIKQRMQANGVPEFSNNDTPLGRGNVSVANEFSQAYSPQAAENYLALQRDNRLSSMGLRDHGDADFYRRDNGPKVTMIANPDAKGGSTLDKVMSQMDFSGGKKLTADGLDALVGASRADTERTRAGNEAVYQQGSLGVQSRGQDLQHELGLRNNQANRLNALLQRDFEMQRLGLEQSNKNREFGLQADKAKQEQYGQRDKLNRDALSATVLQYDKDGKATPESQANLRNVLAKIDGTVAKHGLGMGDLTPDILHNLQVRAGDAAAVDEYLNSTIGKLKRLTGIDKGGVGRSNDLDNYQVQGLTPGALGQRVITPAGEAPLRYLTGGGVTGLDTQNADAKQRIREQLAKNGGR